MAYDPLEDDAPHAGSAWLLAEIDREEQREWSGAEISGRGHAKLLLDTQQISEAEYDDLMHQYDELEEAEPWRRG